MSQFVGSFPLKDLKRRKFQTALTITSLVVCVSVTIFLILFADNLGVEVLSVTEGKLTFGFSEVFSRFILLIVLFNFAAGIMVAYFLMSLTTSQRMQDIGIMKAIGCLAEDIHNFFAIEILIIVSLGCLLGAAFGIFLNYASIYLMNFFGYKISTNPVNPWTIMLSFFSFFLVFYVLGMRRIAKMARIETVKALSPLFVWKTMPKSNLKLPRPFYEMFLAKLVIRNMGRRRSFTVQTLSCLAVILALLTLTVAGGITANETTQSYVERAVGKNTMLVAYPEMAEHFQGLLNRFIEPNTVKEIEYLDERYVIHDSAVSMIVGIEGIVKVDPRIMIKETVHSNIYIRPNPDRPGEYIVIGTYKTSEALIFGVKAESLINDWLLLGKKLGEADSGSVLIGDSLAMNLFDDPWLQPLGFLNSTFNVAGICLDPFNNGMVVYMPYDQLSSLIGNEDYNILLVQVDPTTERMSSIRHEVEEAALSLGLVVVPLDEVQTRHKSFLSSLWSLLLSLSFLCFTNAVISLVGYFMLSIAGQQRDLGIMRALGANHRTILGYILLESFLIICTGALFGLPIGIVIVFWFFIPDAVISEAATLSIGVILSSFIGVLCLSSLYPARRILKMPITKATAKP